MSESRATEAQDAVTVERQRGSEVASGAAAVSCRPLLPFAPSLSVGGVYLSTCLPAGTASGSAAIPLHIGREVASGTTTDTVGAMLTLLTAMYLVVRAVSSRVS